MKVEENCPDCGKRKPIYKDRRNICIHCGADYGRVLEIPLKLKIPFYEVTEQEHHLHRIELLIEDAAKEV